MQWLTIGQMAKLNQISEQTLRLYDKKGLLSPSKRGDGNRYRYYDIKQSAVLDMIQYMKSLGMNLRDIKTRLIVLNLESSYPNRISLSLVLPFIVNSFGVVNTYG